ncbi:MAG: hypothetical protein J5I93_11900 [Pirellulaceae bacterium]|nr:hypothetical protein [Pirellulaceae bacterium]
MIACAEFFNVNVWLQLALALLAAAAVGLGRADRLPAAEGAVVQLPAQGVKIKHGLKLKIDTRGVAANGYKPVVVQLTTWPPVAAAADRTLRVELRPASWGWGAPSPKVSQWIELAQGNARAETVILLPQISRWGSMQIDVFENGRRLEDLSILTNVVNNTRYYGWSEATPSLLFIDQHAPSRDERERLAATDRAAGQTAYSKRFELPDFRGLAASVPGEEYATVFNTSPQRLDDQTLLRLLDELPKVDLTNLESLPPRWIELSCLDLAVVSLADLELLAARRPEALDALRTWMTTGPTLIVYGTGERFERLGALEQLLGLPALTAGGEPPPAGWTRPDPKRFGDQVIRELGQSSASYVNNRRTSHHVSKHVELSTDELYELADKPPPEAPFVWRPAGFGTLVAVAAEDPFPGSAQKWCWLMNSLGGPRYKWHERHGVSQHRRNPEYWQWLIPGVGRAPVVSFIVLISLFAVAIGPVNYFVLKRLRRPYLLLVTVPLGAAAVTLALFGYAMLTDGFVTKVRVRSIALLDQPRGEVVSWSRQTYYASIAPSRGLEFPLDAVVFPVEGNPIRRGNNANADHRLRWDGAQRLEHGYLQSRTTTQFTVGHAGPSDAELVVREPQSAGPPTVENLLAPRILHLMLRDSRGDLYHAEDLSLGSSAKLRAATAAELRELLWPLYEQQKPASPGNLGAREFDDVMLTGMFGYRPSSDTDAGEPEPSFADSALERHLRGFLESPDRLPPRSYLALVASDPQVPLGVPRARQVASFQVIVGNW